MIVTTDLDPKHLAAVAVHIYGNKPDGLPRYPGLVRNRSAMMRQILQAFHDALASRGLVTPINDPVEAIAILEAYELSPIGDRAVKSLAEDIAEGIEDEAILPTQEMTSRMQQVMEDIEEGKQ